MNIKNEKLNVNGMVCGSCEKRIEKELKKLKGVKSVKASYLESTVVIKYDLELCNKKNINTILNQYGYSIINKKRNNKKEAEWIYIIGIIIVALLILRLGENSGSYNISDSLMNNAGFITLFIIGLISSLHCVGMCGGIMMSQSITIDKGSKFESLKPALKYNIGRLISYTVLGGIVGGIGQVISLSLSGQAVIALVAGIFMVVMGLNMYGFKSFRKLSIKLPFSKCSIKKKESTPFIVGLLNGFMPCGPLQTMQLYALATGSILIGAASMFFFALGTIPLMLIFGVITNSLSQKNSSRLIKISGLIIIVLGISMSSRGLTLLGINIPTIVSSNSVASSSNDKNIKGSKAEVVDGKQIVRVSANTSGYTPKVIYIQKDTPTEFIIEGDRITSCNNEIIIPSMNISKKLTSGTNTITFTSEDSDINYSCWMGMKRGVLKVVDDLSSIEQDEVSDNIPDKQEIEFYGIPISKVETDRLIGTSSLSDSVQTIDVTSTAGDFEPAVIILNNASETNLKYKMKDTENDGVYKIVNEDFTEIIATFEIIDGKANIIIPKLELGIYGLVKENNLYSIIEVRDDVEKIDKENIRNKYFNN